MKRIILVFAIVFAFLDFTQSTEEISLAYGKKSDKRYHHKKNDYSQMKKSKIRRQNLMNNKIKI